MKASELRAIAARNGWMLAPRRSLPLPGQAGPREYWSAILDGPNGLLCESARFADNPGGRGLAMKDLCRRVAAIREAK